MTADVRSGAFCVHRYRGLPRGDRRHGTAAAREKTKLRLTRLTADRYDSTS